MRSPHPSVGSVRREILSVDCIAEEIFRLHPRICPVEPNAEVTSGVTDEIETHPAREELPISLPHTHSPSPHGAVQIRGRSPLSSPAEQDLSPARSPPSHSLSLPHTHALSSPGQLSRPSLSLSSPSPPLSLPLSPFDAVQIEHSSRQTPTRTASSIRRRNPSASASLDPATGPSLRSAGQHQRRQHRPILSVHQKLPQEDSVPPSPLAANPAENGISDSIAQESLPSSAPAASLNLAAYPFLSPFGRTAPASIADEFFQWHESISLLPVFTAGFRTKVAKLAHPIEAAILLQFGP